MNLTTIQTVQRPASADEIATWRDGYAWLGGGTWLFSEPQPALDTLIDLEGLGWPALEASADGLTIAATCRIAELYRFEGPPEWTRAAAGPRVLQRVPRLLQDLERGHGRRQHLHVAAGGADDLADRGAGRRLHALAARRQRRARWPWSTSSPAITPTSCGPANCCAASTCRPRRWRGARPSATAR